MKKKDLASTYFPGNEADGASVISEMKQKKQLEKKLNKMAGIPTTKSSTVVIKGHVTRNKTEIKKMPRVTQDINSIPITLVCDSCYSIHDVVISTTIDYTMGSISKSSSTEKYGYGIDNSPIIEEIITKYRCNCGGYLNHQLQELAKLVSMLGLKGYIVFSSFVSMTSRGKIYKMNLDGDTTISKKDEDLLPSGWNYDEDRLIIYSDPIEAGFDDISNHTPKMEEWVKTISKPKKGE